MANSFKKSCIICLKTSDDHKLLLELRHADADHVSFLEKLQDFADEKLVCNEYTLICTTCGGELNSAYNFRKKVNASQMVLRKGLVKNVNFGNLKEVNFEKFEDIPKSVGYILRKKQKIEKDEFFDDEVKEEPLEPADVKSDDESDYGDTASDNFDDFADKDDFLHNPCQYTCMKCSKKFAVVRDLVQHDCLGGPSSQPIKEETTRRKVVIRRKKLILRCDSCELTFDKKWKLNRHNANVHSAEKRHTCSICNKAFKIPSHLREHMTTHTGEKNYLCNICGKMFQRASSKLRHMRAHSLPLGQRVKKTPFLCTICGKSFPYSNGAQRHMRVHTGERKYECAVCHKRFMQTTHLQVHLRTHTGERPYNCIICRQSFPLNASLRKHMKTHQEKDALLICQNLEPNLSHSKEDNLNDAKSYAYKGMSMLSSEQFIMGV